MHWYTITSDHRHHLELDNVYFSVWQVYHICVIILHCVRKWQWYCTTIQHVQLYCNIYKNSILYTNIKCTLDKSHLRLVEYIYIHTKCTMTQEYHCVHQIQCIPAGLGPNTYLWSNKSTTQPNQIHCFSWFQFKFPIHCHLLVKYNSSTLPFLKFDSNMIQIHGPCFYYSSSVL